ncbi:MAG: T9SS type A sorting domain-containing protein, partial [Bacteroidota bacterium]
DWETAAEKNNDHFTVLRSRDGKDFKEIGRVKGSGSTSVRHSYSYTDEYPLPGTSYYILKQTDYNGSSESFDIRRVYLDGIQTESLPGIFNIFPNPFSESFTVQFESQLKEEVQLTLINMKGALAYNEKIIVDEGNNTFHFIPPADFKQGTYMWRLSDSKAVLASGKIVCRK